MTHLVILISLITQKEAIGYSWELLTEVYKLPKDRLYVTYFEGDPKNGLEPDLESKGYWLAQGVPEDHVLPGNAKDNFWGVCLFTPSCIRLSPATRDGRDWSLRPLQVSQHKHAFPT